MPEVLRYVKNDRLGFEVPYVDGSTERHYRPDFIVAVDDGRGSDDPLHLVLEVKEIRRAGDIQIRKLPCRVESIDKAAPDVAIVKIKLPANERLQYLAGQYVDLLLRDGRRRSFSLATSPHEEGLLELHIRYVPGGHFTTQLFNEYKGREILRFFAEHPMPTPR